MDILLGLFIISGLGIIMFIILKVIQDKYRVLVLWPDIRETFEIWLQAQAKKAAATEQLVEKSFYIFVHYLVIKVRNASAWLYNKLEVRNHKLAHLIRGEYKLEKRGQSSSYLNDITDFRNNVRQR